MTTIEKLDTLSLNSSKLKQLYFTKCLISDTISRFCSEKKIDTFGSTIIYGIISKNGNFIKIHRLINDVYFEDKENESLLSRNFMFLNLHDYLKLGNFKISSFLKNKNKNFYQYFINFETEDMIFHMWKSSDTIKEIKYPTHISSFYNEINKHKDLKGFELFSSFKFPFKKSKYIVLDKKLNVETISVEVDYENKIYFKEPDNFEIYLIKEIELPVI